MTEAQAAGMDPLDCAEQIWNGFGKGKSEVVVGGRETLTIALKRLSPKLVETLVRQVAVT